MYTLVRGFRVFAVAAFTLPWLSAFAATPADDPSRCATSDYGWVGPQVRHIVLAQNETSAGEPQPERQWLNRITFGLVGGRDADEKAAAQAGEKEHAKAAKAEAKRAEKEARRQRELEKKQRKETERAARAEDTGERGWLNRMTFGLAGDGGDSAEKQAAKAEKERARAAKAEAERAEKDAKRAEKVARKEEAEIAREEYESQPSSGEKRGFLNRMTFGLVGEGGKATETSQEPAAAAEEKRLAKEAEKQRKLEEKEKQKAEKLARKEERETRKEVETAAQDVSGEKRSLMSRLTFGLVGGEKDSDAAAEVDPGIAEDPAADAEHEEVVATAAEEREPATAAEEKSRGEAEKRPLMSRLTFGLVGGEKELETQPVAPEPTPEQLAMAAPADARYDVQPASAMGAEERRLAALPFRTSVVYDSISGTGKPQATASRETYSKNGYGITDLGDVRIAVRGMTFPDESRAAGVVISSDDRARAAGRGGIGNAAFAYEYERGVTTCTFGTIQFTISKAVISIAGKSVPIGRGRKLIVMDDNGGLIGAYEAQ
jgi:hypothetical protein